MALQLLLEKRFSAIHLECTQDSRALRKSLNHIFIDTMYVRISLKMVKKLFKMLYPEKAMNDGFFFISVSTRSFHVHLRPAQLFYNPGHLNRKCTCRLLMFDKSEVNRMKRY